MKCECENWARKFNIKTIQYYHHPACSKYDKDAEMRELFFKVLPHINDLTAARELSSYLLVSLIQSYEFTKRLSDEDFTKYVIFDIMDTLRNPIKYGFVIDFIEYTTDKYTFHFVDDNNNFVEADCSYELAIKHIPYPIGKLVLIEK